MRYSIVLLARLSALGLASGLAGAAAAAPPSVPVEVMVLGAYHFANPGRDLNNVTVDSVLTPERQAELDRVARAIAAFRPTKVMVEMQGSGPDLAIAEYRQFDDAMLARDPNEIVQIGYRIARLAGLATVHGIDEQPKAGEPDYFPFDKVEATAERSGQAVELAATNAGVAAFVADFQSGQRGRSIAQSLIAFNTPGTAVAGMDSYYAMLPIGDFDDQPGADLNAMWYLRNAKIFAKLMRLAPPRSAARERVLVVYGGGHGFWLRHFAGLTPGYRNVDALPYLKKAR